MQIELKTIHTQLRDAKRNIKNVKSDIEITNLQIALDPKDKNLINKNIENFKKVVELNSIISDLNNQIKVFQNGIIITEHAILRYFERVLGYNLEEIKSQIVPPKILQQIEILKSGNFPVGDFKIVVKKNKVITVLTKDED